MALFLVFSPMMLQGISSPIMAAGEITVNPSDPIEKDTGGKDSTIPIKVTIPSTPINVTLPSSIEISFPSDDVKGIVASNFTIINNSKTRSIEFDSIEAKIKDNSWKLVQKSSDEYFQNLSFDSKELYLGIELSPEVGYWSHVCVDYDCNASDVCRCKTYEKQYNISKFQVFEVFKSGTPCKFIKTSQNKWIVKPDTDSSSLSENSTVFKLEAKTGGVSSAVSGQDLVDIILTFKN